MTKCVRCKQHFKNILPFTFSGIKGKFCQTCWHQIFIVYSASKMLKNDIELWDWVKKINEYQG